MRSGCSPPRSSTSRCSENRFQRPSAAGTGCAGGSPAAAGTARRRRLRRRGLGRRGLRRRLLLPGGELGRPLLQLLGAPLERLRLLRRLPFARRDRRGAAGKLRLAVPERGDPRLELPLALLDLRPGLLAAAGAGVSASACSRSASRGLACRERPLLLGEVGAPGRKLLRMLVACGGAELVQPRGHLALPGGERGLARREPLLLGEQSLDPLVGALLEALHEALGHGAIIRRSRGRAPAAAEQEQQGDDEPGGEARPGPDRDQARQLGPVGRGRCGRLGRHLERRVGLPLEAVQRREALLQRRPAALRQRVELLGVAA